VRLGRNCVNRDESVEVIKVKPNNCEQSLILRSSISSQLPHRFSLRLIRISPTHVVNGNFLDGSALCAFLAQIILIIEYQVHLALEQLRLEEVFNDDGSFMLRSIASHFLGPPVKQSYRREKR
jgi:hypothetical protein